MALTSDELDFDKTFDALLDAPVEEHPKMLAAIEKRHPSAIPRLRRLLAFAIGDTKTPERADDTAPELLGQMLAHQDLDRVGSDIGPYKIRSLINSGGMGIVFRAERHDGAYEQTVAVKFLPRLARSEQRRQLFLNERANLARLEHPNIARIIDAGLTEDEAPYFVMEYIAGMRIDEYCGALPLRQWLALFQQVCAAINYCHQSFVVHGDIKPSNILVADNRVRILDFGIATWTKAASHGETGGTGFSKGYAAPELEATGMHSVATDIYSLGMLLKRLLAASDTEPTQDLVVIAEQCLADQPSERFRSVEALSSEIDAFLAGRPISGRQHDRAYVLARLIVRNKLAIAGVAAVIISLVIGLSTALWQYNKASLETMRAEETAGFVKSLFDRINPEDAGATDLTLRQVLDEAAQRIDSELLSSPEVRADVMALLGSAYTGLGDYERSLSLRQSVLDYHSQTKTAPNIDIATALGEISASYQTAGDYELARNTMRRALDQFDALGEADSLTYADLLGRYALMMTNRAGGRQDVAAAIAALEKKGAILEQKAPQDIYLKYIHLTNLASGYDELGEHSVAASLKEEAVALADASGYSLQVSAITTLCNLGYSYDRLGRLEDAVATHQRCIERREQRLGDDHPDLISARQNLAAAQIGLGKFTEAKAVLQISVASAERLLPEKSFPRLAAEINLARVNILTGAADDALRTLPSILSRMQQAVGEDGVAAGRVRSILGLATLEAGDIDSAIVLLRTAYQTIEASDYWQIEGCQWCSDVALWRAQAEYVAGNTDSARELANVALTILKTEENVSAWRMQAVLDFVTTVSE